MSPPREGAPVQTTDDLLRRLTLIGQLLPEADVLSEYVRACDREEGLAPVLHPSAYRRAQKRLPATKELAEAALEYRRAFERLLEVAEEEADEEADAAVREALAQERRRLRERAGGGS